MHPVVYANDLGQGRGRTVPHNAGVVGSSPTPAIIGSLGSPIGCRGVFMFVLSALPRAGNTRARISLTGQSSCRARSDRVSPSCINPPNTCGQTFDISRHRLRLDADDVEVTDYH